MSRWNLLSEPYDKLSDKLQSSALPLSRYTLFGHIYAHYIEANLLSCFFKLDKIWICIALLWEKLPSIRNELFIRPHYNIYSISKQIGTKLELNIFWRPLENVLCPILKVKLGIQLFWKELWLSYIGNFSGKCRKCFVHWAKNLG